MSVKSPDLIDANAVGVSLPAASAVSTRTSEDVFVFLAQCDCIADLAVDLDVFVSKLDSATRDHLSQLPSFWRSRVGFWSRLRFASYRAYVTSKMSPAQLDVAQVELLLKNIHVADLFAPGSEWASLKLHAMGQFESFVTRLGGVDEIERICESAFRRQRASLFKDWLIRFVPTLVLISAVTIAVAMAFRFARSLTLGQ